MKPSYITYSALLLLSAASLRAQTDVQNNGTLFVTGATDVYISGALINASGAALTNNGNVYVLKNLTNNQSGMSAGTGTLYLSGSTAQTVDGTQTFKTLNLVSNNAAGILLNNNLSVSGAHTFSAGVITTSATPNYLVYEAGSSYSGDADTRHVNGWVQKIGSTAFLYPVGNGSVERKIGTSSLSASSVFNATYAGPTPNVANMVAPLVSIDPYEYWVITRVSGGTARIDMNWDNSKVNMPPYALADIRTANFIAGNWTQTGGAASGNVATTGTISSNVVSSFGSFALGSISFALPVNLIDFSAYRNNGNTIVNWLATDEVSLARYEVQRSDDGIVYSTLSAVPARNQTGLQQYSFTDTRSMKAFAWYRLLSVDIDGKSHLSKAIRVTNTDALGQSLTVVNPVHSSIRLAAQKLEGSFEYRLTTLSGQTIRKGNIQLSAGSNNIYLGSAVAQGLYLLEVQKPGFSFSQKILVQ